MENHAGTRFQGDEQCNHRERFRIVTIQISHDSQPMIHVPDQHGLPSVEVGVRGAEVRMPHQKFRLGYFMLLRKERADGAQSEGKR